MRPVNCTYFVYKALWRKCMSLLRTYRSLCKCALWIVHILLCCALSNTDTFKNCKYYMAHYYFLLQYIQKALYLHKRALYFHKMPSLQLRYIQAALSPHRSPIIPQKYPICQQNTPVFQQKNPAFQQKSPVNCTYDIAHYCFLLRYIQRALYLHKRALYFRKMPYELYISHSALSSPLIHTRKSPISSQKSPILPQKRPANCTYHIVLCSLF